MKVRRFTGLQDYASIWQAMRTFTDQRTPETEDEIWLMQHTPVFTVGQAGSMSHLLRETDIPVVHSDRGGQITYHGPGQLVVYLLVDLSRRHLGVRELVNMMERSLVRLLERHGITAYAKPAAPGVYVNDSGHEAKIASLGLRVRRGRSYHGLSLNVAMDLAPFQLINPCGYPGLTVVQMADLLLQQPDMMHIENTLGMLLTEALEQRSCTPG